MLRYSVAASAGRAQAPSFRRQNLVSKSYSRALLRRFNSRSPAQPTVILDSNARAQTAGRSSNAIHRAFWSARIGSNLWKRLYTRAERRMPRSPGHRLEQVRRRGRAPRGDPDFGVVLRERAEVDCRSETSRNLDKCVIALRGSEVQTGLDILPLKKRIVCEDFIP
jgi:hypothetical protein